MYKIIKKFLAEGGRCILIENNKPIGVVLTVEEYELLRSKCEIPACAEASAGRQNPKSETEIEKEKPLFSGANLPPQTPPYQGGGKGEVVAANPIGEAMAREIDYPGASAEIADIEATDDVTLEDLGIDELPY